MFFSKDMILFILIHDQFLSFPIETPSSHSLPTTNASEQEACMHTCPYNHKQKTDHAGWSEFILSVEIELCNFPNKHMPPKTEPFIYGCRLLHMPFKLVLLDFRSDHVLMLHQNFGAALAKHISTCCGADVQIHAFAWESK